MIQTFNSHATARDLVQRRSGRIDLGQLQAFTLLEMIGVLTILALLGALAAPAIIRQIDQASLTRETADLNTFADALALSIVRSKNVPSVAGIPSAITSESAVALAQITATPLATQRAFLVDPSVSIGSGLPYTQTGNLGMTNLPAAARVLIVSSLSRANPLTSSETNNSPANFNAIWFAPQSAKPTTWVTWKGAGDDLHIQRLNLGPLFHRLILVNHDPDSGHDPRYSIDAAISTSAPALMLESYYLEGTVVGLYVGTELQNRHVLTSDISFVFENNTWRGLIGQGAPPTGLPEDFTSSANGFLRADWNPDAHQGASQLSIISSMSSFMRSYTEWANPGGCPHFPYHANPGSRGTVPAVNVPEYNMIDAFGGRNQFLDRFSGTSGILK